MSVADVAVADVAVAVIAVAIAVRPSGHLRARRAVPPPPPAAATTEASKGVRWRPLRVGPKRSVVMIR